jgi:hypothetical protein
MLLRFLHQVRMPGKPAAVIATDNRDDLDRLAVGVTKAAHHADRHGDGVERSEFDLVLALLLPGHRQLAINRHEDFFRGVSMESGTPAWLDLDQAEAEGMLDRDRWPHGRVLTAQVDIDLTDGGTSIGTITIATDGNTAKSVAAGSVIRFVAPASTHATVAGIALTLIGSLD